MHAASRCALAFDPATLPDLKLLPAETGLGNRIGWYLTAAALGQALNRSVVTWLAAGDRQGGHAYDTALLLRAMAWPKALRFLERDRQGPDALAYGEKAKHQAAWAGAPFAMIPGKKALLRAARGSEVSYVTSSYVPSWSWLLLLHYQAALGSVAIHSRQKRAEALFMPRDLHGAPASALPRSASACLTKQAYLAAYRTVQNEVRALVDLCNPSPRSYVAIHSRRTDRASAHNAAIGRRSTAHAGMPILRPTEHTAAQGLMAGVSLRALQTVSAGVRPLPFLVVSDSARQTAAIETHLESHNFAVVRRAPRCPPAEALLEIDRHSNASAMAFETLAAVRDWFALWGSAGVLADVGSPWGGWAESSFSTTAALASDVPLYTTRSPTGCTARGAVPHFSGECARLDELPDVPQTFAARDASAFATAACRKSLGRCQVRSLAEQKAELLARERTAGLTRGVVPTVRRHSRLLIDAPLRKSAIA